MPDNASKEQYLGYLKYVIENGMKYILRISDPQDKIDDKIKNKLDTMYNIAKDYHDMKDKNRLLEETTPIAFPTDENELVACESILKRILFNEKIHLKVLICSNLRILVDQLNTCIT
jgi:hypothetical protein